MANQVLVSLSIVLLAVLVVSSFGNLHSRKPVQPSADDAFNNYILNATQNYTTWVTENNLDPTPPISEALSLISLPTAPVVLDCQLTNQQISGDSDNTTHDFDAGRGSRFTFIRVSRLDVPNKFNGNFKCMGKMNPEAGEKYSFQGEGTYQLNTREVDTMAYYRNLGVTEEYKLDFSEAYIDIILYADFNGTNLLGKWNDTRITDTVVKAIANEFSGLYGKFLEHERTSELHPGIALLPGFLRNVTKDLDLTTILDDADVPDPFKPTPATINAPPTSESQTEPTTDGNNVATITSISSILALICLIFQILTFVRL